MDIWLLGRPVMQRARPPSLHFPTRRNSLPHTLVQKYMDPLRRTKSEPTLKRNHRDKTVSMIPFQIKHKWSDSFTLCSIYMDPLCTIVSCNETHIRELPCQHRFHTECIQGPTKWMPKHATSPLCRKTAYQLHLPERLLTMVRESLENPFYKIKLKIMDKNSFPHNSAFPIIL